LFSGIINLISPVDSFLLFIGKEIILLLVIMPISDTLDSKRILITGGTGSFGNYILKELANYGNIQEIIVLSRDEDKQHYLKQRYSKYSNIKFELGDVRNLERMKEVCRKIDIIFNAAALKQVPNSESNPYEVILTNVIGAKNIAVAAIENNVEKVIGISTDKAVKPINTMGMTKALQEKIFTAESTNQTDTKFACVRYGNVIGSRGSVIPFFQTKIEQGEQLPVTHPEMTRFLLTLKDAINLTLHTINDLTGGEIFVKKIPSCKITLLAEVMYKMLNPSYALNRETYFIAGVRPGEKIHEILISEDEARNRVESRGDYYIIHPYWDECTFPPMGEYSSNLQTINNSQDLEMLLLSADNINLNIANLTSFQSSELMVPTGNQKI
jgi:UDP-N-acetylglucosamine 4,6-dehydratase/5-epimerase